MINTKHKTPNTAKIDRPVSEADFETTGFSSLAFYHLVTHYHHLQHLHH